MAIFNALGGKIEIKPIIVNENEQEFEERKDKLEALNDAITEAHKSNDKSELAKALMAYVGEMVMMSSAVKLHNEMGIMGGENE